ncbi:alpha/beta fold hydrolase [Candidatus Obscuribacterales bacterium]|nr:alpha/beta fold hydrolase [Candidatus Obscuribacterales bacterium]MBX3137181.1 alpha/beta fold hydrolase [Candidatus Obscuribacterales bacterium]
MKDLVSIPLPPVQEQAVQPEHEWLRASDGSQLFCRIWRGKVGAPVVLYIHGIEGHSQWFENTASILNSKGITVYAPDRRGSGMNSRDRGHVTSYKVFIDDLNAILRKICNQHMGHPIILWGNCWGAKPATLFAQENSKGASELGVPDAFPISALVLSSPAIYSKVDYDLKTKLEIAANAVLGDRRALRKWPIPLTTQMFTDNPVYFDFLEKDPLRLHEATATFFVESYKIGGMAEKAAGNISMPVIILQPGNDVIVDTDKLSKWFAKLKSPDKTMRLFPDAQHCLDFDANWFKEYTHLISEWLLSRLPAVS